MPFSPENFSVEICSGNLQLKKKTTLNDISCDEIITLLSSWILNYIKAGYACIKLIYDFYIIFFYIHLTKWKVLQLYLID